MTRIRGALLGAFVVGLGASVTLAESALVGLAGLWLWRLREAEARARVPTTLAWPVLALAGASVLSAGLAPAGDLLATRDVLLAGALFASADALDDTRAADRLVWLLSLIVAAAAMVGLVQVAACPDPQPTEGLARWFFRRCHRAHGFFSIYMTFAGVLLPTLLVTLPRLLPGPGFRGWALVPWLVSLAGLAASYTRGAWLGLVGGTLVMVALARRGRALLVLGLVAAAAVALIGPAGLRARVQTIVDPRDPTIVERRHMWGSGLAMWRTRPWLGVGPGGVKRLFAEFAHPEAAKRRVGHLHSAPLQILTERGVVGLAAWLWIWGAFFAAAVRTLAALPAACWRERALVSGSMAAVAGFLVAGLTEDNFGDSEVALVVWTLMSLPFVAGRPWVGAGRATDR